MGQPPPINISNSNTMLESCLVENKVHVFSLRQNYLSVQITVYQANEE
jgi:hypothetical protein